MSLQASYVGIGCVFLGRMYTSGRRLEGACEALALLSVALRSPDGDCVLGHVPTPFHTLHDHLWSAR